MGVVYLAYHAWIMAVVPTCTLFCAFYIFNTTPNPTSSSFFQNVFVLFFFKARVHVCAYVHACMCV